MGGDPSAYLLNKSRCRHNEEFGRREARGMGGEGWMWKVRFRASYKSDIAMFSKIPEGKLCMLYPELPNQHFLLCLIFNWIHCPKCTGLLCFFSEVPNSNFERNGVLGSCSVFSRIPTEH